MTIQFLRKSVAYGSAALILAGLLGAVSLARAADDTKKPAPSRQHQPSPRPNLLAAPAAGPRTEPRPAQRQEPAAVQPPTGQRPTTPRPARPPVTPVAQRIPAIPAAQRIPAMPAGEPPERTPAPEASPRRSVILARRGAANMRSRVAAPSVLALAAESATCMTLGAAWTSITTWAAAAESPSSAPTTAASLPSAAAADTWSAGTVTEATILAGGLTTTMAMNTTATIAATDTAACI